MENVKNIIMIIKQRWEKLSGIYCILNLLNGKKVFNIDYEYGRDGCNVPDMSPYPIIFDKDFFYINNFLCRTIRAYDVNNGKEVALSLRPFEIATLKISAK